MQPQNHLAGALASPLEDLLKRINVLEETIAQLRTIDVALQELQTIVGSFIEGIQQGLVLIQDGNIIWANAIGCRMLGYEPEELINTSVIALAHPDYRQKLEVRIRMIELGDVLPTYDIWPFLTKGRVLKQLSLFANRAEYRGKPAILSIFLDVTEDKKLNEDLTLRAEMLDLVSDSVFLLDMKGNIKYVNKAVCQALGYTQDEITSMSIMDLNADELKRKAEIRLKTVSSQKESRFSTVHMRKNGSRMPVDVRVKVIKRGEQQFILGVVREIIPEGLQDI
jgi:PAS domain S-box-containing protein